MKLGKRTALALLAAALVWGGAAYGQDTIKIGGLATLEGTYAVLGEDSMRGIEMALKENDYTAGGKKIELIKASSDATPDSAVQAARRLVEQDGVDILIGPLSGSEGLAIKDFAKTHPEVTFVNGTSAAQDTTLREPAPNFFRFTTDGAQWMAGLGDYVYNKKDYKKVVVVGDDYSFEYTQVFGFMHEYCGAGGHVVKKFWVPLGTKDYSSVVVSIPDDIDAIAVFLGGADALNFLNQYRQVGGTKPMIGGSIAVDQTVLSAKGPTKRYLVGTPSAGPIADSWDNPKWRAFVDRYKEMFPDGFASPSLFATGYYVETSAVVEALNAVDGDLSDNHAKLRDYLANTTFDTPTGKRHLDQNRQAVADIFVTEVDEGDDGKLYNKVVKVVPQVNQTMGMDRDKFLALGRVGRDNPQCP
ncbi:MAG: ABC transporter substrate-binding protein [Ectothiorhodospiraceae bacterium]|jgi:branched-chain amino acid transport system substrate-binding protein